MRFHWASTARLVATKVCILGVTSLAWFVIVGSAQAVDITVGPKELIYSTSQRKSRNLATWPDGNFGIVANGDGQYEFYAANGGKPAKTTGTLDNPGQSKKKVTISGVPKKAFDYLAGGPVYHDPATGARLMIYHAEKHGRSARSFYSMLGLAVSTDPNGLWFHDLGTILKPNLSGGRAEIGGGSFAVVDDYLHVYFRDSLDSGGSSELAVARAPLGELLSNSLNYQSTSFTKYYNGDWSEPGLGGLSSPLEVGNPSNGWSTFSYNDYLDQLVMVSAQWTTYQSDLYLATSQDGIHWSPRQPLVLDAGEQFYPTLIGKGSDPLRSDQSFYLYYTDSKKGAWNRWKDAQLVRREITLDPFGTPTLSGAQLLVTSGTVVPEPNTLVLLILSSAGLFPRRRRRNARHC